MFQRCDVAVVGLGLFGAAALRHVTRRLAGSGARVVGIGPTEPPAGAKAPVYSSHYDSGRITRVADPDPVWAELARRSIDWYGRLEAESGVRFHSAVGALRVHPDRDAIERVAAVAADLGTPTEVTPAAEAAERGYRLPDDSWCLYEPPPAGLIDPRRMLQAELALALRDGAEIVRDVAVGRIRAGGSHVVRTASGLRFEAPTVIVATGAYLGQFDIASEGPALRVKTETIVRLPVGGDEPDGGMPSLIWAVDHPVIADCYVVPPVCYPDGTRYLKAGANTTGDRLLADADEMSRWMAAGNSDAHLDAFREVLSALLPSRSTRDLETGRCLVAYTRHARPYVAQVDEGLVVAAGGNGRGAKSADAIGDLAAALAVEGAWSDPLPAELFAAS